MQPKAKTEWTRRLWHAYEKSPPVMKDLVATARGAWERQRRYGPYFRAHRLRSCGAQLFEASHCRASSGGSLSATWMSADFTFVCGSGRRRG